MTKLSDIKASREADTKGTWFFWRGTIYIRAARHGVQAYQRAVRLAQLDHPDPAADESAQEKLDHEERLGRALIPAVAKCLLLDWWGADDEAEPVELQGEPALVAEVDGVRLETLEVDGKLYRREGDKWQPMLRYSPELGERYLADPDYADLLNAVHGAASILDARFYQRSARALGKSSNASSGTSTTAPTRSG